MTKPKWTDETTKRLRKMWEQGKSARDIGEALGGFTRNAVIGKANRMGLSIPKKDDTPPPKKASKKTNPKKAGPKKATKQETNTTKAPPYMAKSCEHLCQWPIGEPGENDFHFCHAPSESGRPYCAEHCDLAYRPIT